MSEFLMAKKDIKFIQFEPAAAISDPDVQTWGPKEIGCYWTIIFNLYCNGGSLPNDLGMLAKLCRCHRGVKFYRLSTGFHRIWGKIGKKFQSKNGEITHRRVSVCIATAYERMEKRRNAALEGAKARWQPDSNRIKGDAIAPVSKEEEEVKLNISYSYEKNCEISSFSIGGMRSSASLELAKIFNITPDDTSDITTISDILNQLEEKVYRNKLKKEIFNSLIAVARSCSGHKKWGKFINKMKGKKFGYVPVGREYVK